MPSARPPSRLLPRLDGADLALLAGCLLAAGAWSVRAGTDRNWDLQNYHLYAPLAWIQGRLFRDVAAAQLQSFFNPLLHMPWFAAHRLLDGWPRSFAFLSGLPAGLLAFMFLRVAAAHAALLLPGHARLAAAGAGVLGLTGAAFVPGIGLSSGDIWVGIPLMAAYGLVLRAAIRRGEGEAAGLGAMALAGALAGLATGLKLTAMPTAAALGIMILLTLGLRAAVAAGLAMGAAFLLGWAPHAWRLWMETGSPTFPLYNQVFRSPDFLPIPLMDERFLPRSLPQALLYPFWWLERSSNLVSELPLRDWRMAMGMLAALLALPPLLHGAAGRGTRAAWLLLGTSAIGYAIWAWLFGIYRYLVVPEMLAALLVLLAAALLARGRPRPALAGMAVAILLALPTTIRPNWGHGPHGARLLASEPLPPGPDALLLTTDWEPYGYLAVLLPEQVTMLGLHVNFMQPGPEHGLARRIRERLAAHRGPVWAAHAPGETARRDATLAAHGLAVAGECRLVRTSLATHSFCPVGRVN